MGRPREFNRDEALDVAMREFWLRGYDAPTMTELRVAMGIGRQSLYDTFGDKERLFHEALERYLSASISRNAEILGQGDGLGAIGNYLDGTASNLADDPERKGCLMFNTCMGVAPHDAEIEQMAMRGVNDLRRRFEAALRRAVEQEQIPGDSDVKKLALFLVSQVGGMVVLARAGASKKELRAVAQTAQRLLE